MIVVMYDIGRLLSFSDGLSCSAWANTRGQTSHGKRRSGQHNQVCSWYCISKYFWSPAIKSWKKCTSYWCFRTACISRGNGMFPFSVLDIYYSHGCTETWFKICWWGKITYTSCFEMRLKKSPSLKLTLKMIDKMIKWVFLFLCIDSAIHEGPLWLDEQTQLSTCGFWGKAENWLMVRSYKEHMAASSRISPMLLNFIIINMYSKHLQ